MELITGRERLLITRHRNHAVHDPRSLRRLVTSGEMIRLRSGAYVRSSVWASLSFDEQRRLEIAAALDATTSRPPVSSRSAASVWGVPLIGRHDGLVHVRTTIASGTRTEHGFRKHAVHDLDQHLTEHLGVLVTTRERTVVDLALSEAFAAGVVAVDWALRSGIERSDLLRVLEEAAPKQGRRRAERTIGFGDGRSGSAGESWSRVQMDEAHLSMPVLQEPFTDDLGLIGYVDLFWPRLGLVGEFDGIGKLTDPAMLAGRTPPVRH